MARQLVAPVHVRLSPEVLEALRRAADQRKTTVHAEVVRAVEAQLAREGEEAEVRALKAVTAALVERFAWFAPADGDDHRQLLIDLFKAATGTLFDGLGASSRPSAEVQTIGQAAARKLLADMQSGSDVSLADAGRALGLLQEKRP